MNGANDPLDPMNVPAHPEDNGAGGESLLAPWMQRELGERSAEPSTSPFVADRQLPRKSTLSCPTPAPS